MTAELPIKQTSITFHFRQFEHSGAIVTARTNHEIYICTYLGENMSWFKSDCVEFLRAFMEGGTYPIGWERVIDSRPETIEKAIEKYEQAILSGTINDLIHPPEDRERGEF